MSETLRQFLESRGLQLVRQKKAGDRSRVWIPRTRNGDEGEFGSWTVWAEGANVDEAIGAFVRKLQGKTIVIDREYPDSYTITLPANFGEDEHGNISGLVPFEEMYDANNPPPAAAEPLWLGQPMIDEQKVGPLTLRQVKHDKHDVWSVIILDGDGAERWLLSGIAEQVDADTRAWLAPLAEVIDGLRGLGAW